MSRLIKNVLILSTLTSIAASEPQAVANPVGDFFKKVGRSISHLGKNSSHDRTGHKSEKKSDDSGNGDAGTNEAASTTQSAITPAPTPVDIRPASLAAPDQKGPRRDVPYGVIVPNKPGFVTSPYAPTQGIVDVRSFPSSTEVLDPFTGKIFLTP